MKLSDLFASLSKSAQDLEARAAEWEGQLRNRGDQLVDDAKKWLASAQERDDELRAKTTSYLNDASEQVKAQWAKTQSEWDAEFVRLKARAEEAQKKAQTMQSKELADWYEAYAAHMVSFAERVQQQASNAVAGAAKARADAGKPA